MFITGFCAQARDNHECIFTHIYQKAIWGKNTDGKGSSGGGSLERATVQYRDFLQHFLKEKKIKTVVDAGCGDWQFSRLVDWSGIEYIGYDIVGSVIENNIKKYGSSALIFIHGNFLSIDLPSADLLLCKHVLQHLTNADIISFLPQLKKYKYCLITNQVNPRTLSGSNKDIRAGGGRKLDLTKSPFYLDGQKALNYDIKGLGTHQILLVDNTKA